MENKQEMQKILEKLEKTGRRQALFTKILCVLCVAVLVCTLVLTVSVVGAANQLLAMAEPLQEMAGQVGTVMDDLGEVATALKDADLSSIVQSVNFLAADSQVVVSEATAKLEAIDIDTLNKAIRDLADIVEPLAKVSKYFG